VKERWDRKLESPQLPWRHENWCWCFLWFILRHSPASATTEQWLSIFFVPNLEF